jgi:hypothetical protein
MNSAFHKTKIPTVDMKVQVYSKFSKNKIRKKIRSASSMRNARIHTPKCRGCCRRTPPTKPRPLLHARALKIF